MTTNALDSIWTVLDTLGDNEDEEIEIQKEMSLKYYMINRTGYPICIHIPDKDLSFYWFDDELLIINSDVFDDGDTI